MTDALFANAPAVLTGFTAAFFLTVAPLFPSRRAILISQLAAGIAFASHYAVLGIAVASLVNCLGCIQTVAAMLAGRSRAFNRLGYALIVMMMGVGLWFWQGPISLLSVTAMTLIALARMQQCQIRLRLLLLAGGVFWMAHDYLSAAWIALAADIGALAIGSVALFNLLFCVTIRWRAPSSYSAYHLPSP